MKHFNLKEKETRGKFCFKTLFYTLKIYKTFSYSKSLSVKLPVTNTPSKGPVIICLANYTLQGGFIGL